MMLAMLTESLPKATSASLDWFHFDVVDQRAYYEALADKRRYSPIELVTPHPQLTESVVAVYRYEDVANVVTDETLFSADILAERYRPVFGRRTLLALSWRERRLFRSVLGTVLGPRNLQFLASDVVEPVVERVAGEALAKGRLDVVRDVARLVPSLVMTRLFGLPDDLAPTLLGHSVAMVRYVDDPKGAVRGARALRKLFRALISERRQAAKNDLVSRLVSGDECGDHLDNEDLVDLLVLLSFAGTETAFPGIGSLFFGLLTHAEQLDAVQSDPTLAKSAADEALRWEAPVQVTFRAPTHDVIIGGVPVAAGTPVMAHLGSANHDIPGMADLDSFDVHRPSNRHLAFGHGTHRCIGMHLARLQMALTVRHVLAACPRLRLARGEEPTISGQIVRGPVSLIVETS
jgi:cytochrome P450